MAPGFGADAVGRTMNRLRHQWPLRIALPLALLALLLGGLYVVADAQGLQPAYSRWYPAVFIATLLALLLLTLAIIQQLWRLRRQLRRGEPGARRPGRMARLPPRGPDGVPRRVRGGGALARPRPVPGPRPRRPGLGSIDVRETIDLPIGVFDSGFGGLTVLSSLVEQMPNEDFVYLGDTARAPYGPLSIAEVRANALEGLDHLVSFRVKALVIACNSASSAVLRDARERYDVPIVEVVLPAARKAAATTRNGKVGVICTAATATSRSYNDALAASPVSLQTQVCPRFVELVEAGVTSGPEVVSIAEQDLTPLKEAGVDTLILGCTHYPLLSGVISYVMGDDVTLVSSADRYSAG